MHTFPGGLKILRMCSCMPSELKLKMVSVNLVKMMSLKETKKNTDPIHRKLPMGLIL